MAGLLSGLGSLGLGNLEEMNIYEEEKKPDQENKAPEIKEEDFIYDKTLECPVCGDKFSTKIMKTGKAKLIHTDRDLRPKYEGVDAVKYDVYLCPVCGYAALSRYFGVVTPTQAKLIKTNISQNIQLHDFQDTVYGYEEAIERYKLALANAVVKKAKNSEKAYICLKSAWLMRGYGEEATAAGDKELAADAAAAELEYTMNAFNGFMEARKTEDSMCGMDKYTIDYLIAALALKLGKVDVASRMLSEILSSSAASARAKEKARELREAVAEENKKNKQS